MARFVDPLVVGRVIGEVVDLFVPSISMTAAYGDRDISNGCLVRPSAADYPPLVRISGRRNDLYTLVSVYICIITYLSSNLLTIDQFARSPTHACRSWRTRTHLALATHPWGSFSTGMYVHWSIHPSIPWDVAHQQVSILHKYTSLTLACIYMIWYDMIHRMPT